jgi:UDP-N-acetyl-D-glucosamine dehydrogenase
MATAKPASAAGPLADGGPVDPEAVGRRIEQREARVGVIGLGYVGLPLALACCRAGFGVMGFEIDAAKARSLNDGVSYLSHIGNDKITAARAGGRFEATADFARLAEADVILICVPTPLGRHREPDLTFVESTARQIAAALRPGQLVELESTSYPGTTSEVVKPILESTGRRSGVDFFLAYSPEREDPGNPDFETSRIPKVVGGDGEIALRLACALYDRIVVRTVPVSSLATAEAVKITENVFRAVNIALVNELKIVFAAMGIDVAEVIDAAKTKPFGFMAFYPGPGLGGHCIPIDPFYLTWKAHEYGVHTRFIELAGEINTAMPHYVIGRLREELDRRFGRGLSGARVLIVGVAYKRDVADVRESPALTIMARLGELGAQVDYHDPFVAQVPPTRRHPGLAGKTSVALEPAVLERYDAALIVTDHRAVDHDLLLRHCRLVVDTRNVIPRDGRHAGVVTRA